MPKLFVAAMNEPTVYPYTAILDWPVCNDHVKELEDRAKEFIPAATEHIARMHGRGARSVVIHHLDRWEAQIVFYREITNEPDVTAITVDKINVESDEYKEFKKFLDASRPPNYPPPLDETPRDQELEQR